MLKYLFSNVYQTLKVYLRPKDKDIGLFFKDLNLSKRGGCRGGESYRLLRKFQGLTLPRGIREDVREEAILKMGAEDE